jgi:hypothetical protein
MTDPGYKTLVSTLKKQRGGMTIADMAAATALPLAVIRELIPRAADEYRARLEVTESGEIRYSFPRGFSSRYRSPGAVLERFAGKARDALARFLAAAFKVWIMVMLVGYFALFLLIALAAVVFVFAASASSSNNRNGRRNSDGEIGGAYLFPRLIDMVFRFWFYSHLFGSGNRDRGAYSRRSRRDGDGRPLYKQIFSFVFGDGDPNAGWAEREAREVIAYLRGRKGVIALPEFMALTGLEPIRAEREILVYCARYGGMPEATENGTVVYRFDPLLPAARQNGVAALKPPRKAAWTFSANTSTSNAVFALINGVNLAFGLYFLYFTLNLNALAAGTPLGGSFLFIYVYRVLAGAGINPFPVIFIALGIVPLLFSLLFWLIPALRRAGLKRKNAAVRVENARKAACVRIWEKPLDITEESLAAVCADKSGGADKAAADALIKEIGAYSIPDVNVDERGRVVYAFTGIAEERAALEKYRAGIGDGAGELGGVVFDSE